MSIYENKYLFKKKKRKLVLLIGIFSVISNSKIHSQLKKKILH